MLEIKKIDVSTVLLEGMFRKQFLKSLSLFPLQKQIRSVERYIRKLEFHISKVKGFKSCTSKAYTAV